MQGPIDYFSSLEDPRVERTKDHQLSDIIFITIAAVICGAETWNEIELYGKTKEDWLKRHLQLSNGIPSHDTFNRVFSSLDPDELERCFLNWVKDVTSLTDGEIISIDGKSIRGSKKRGAKSMVHMVSAWAQKNHMVLGQVKVDDKSNEITAIPKLLDVLALKGCIVTIDAMGCQTEIAQKIRDKEADYLLAVKGNQSSLQQEMEDTIKFCKPVDVYENTDYGHGRIETRKCTVYTDLSHINNMNRWSDIRGIVQIESTRVIKASGETQKESRLYITSMEPVAHRIEQSVRAHWAIENSLHWVLDVAFNEDKGSKTNQNAVQNFAIINRIALNLVKNEKSKKVGVKSRRLNAGWDNDFLLKILKN